MTNYFIHPNAIIETGVKIGKGSRIWAFAHILPGAIIGENCNICDSVFIENEVIIGDRVTIKNGVQLWNGIIIQDDVFIGPNATFTNDPFPRSKHEFDKTIKTVVEMGASIGANATILPGLHIGRNAMVGAGAVITRNVPQNAIVFGNPARIKGYVNSFSQKPIQTITPNIDLDITRTKVPEVEIYKLPQISDIKGELTFGEYNKHLPFIPIRYFVIYGVPTKEVRGEHMHKTLHEFLVCLKGSVNILLDNGKVQEEIILNNPHIGIHIPPNIWTVQYKYSPDAILLVLASEIYDPDDYIRDYDEFLNYINSKDKK